MAGGWGSVQASLISTENGTPQGNRGPTASAHIVRQHSDNASKGEESFLLVGTGLHTQITKGTIAANLTQAGASWDADGDMRNGVSPLCAQLATQRCRTLFSRVQRGFGLHWLTWGATCKTICSVYAASVPRHGAITKPPGSANMPGAKFAMDRSPCVVCMKFPSGAVVYEFTSNGATAKQKNVRPGVLKDARLSPKSSSINIARMSAVGKLWENGLSNEPRPRWYRRQSITSEGGRFGRSDLA